MIRLATVLAGSILATGCMNMSGLDASSKFACKAPDGVTCQTVSGVYYNSVQNNLPSQQVQGKAESPAEAPEQRYAAAESAISPRGMVAPQSGIPIRKPPKIVRIWVAPWEDEAGDLHDQSYFYTMINPGRWMIETNKAAVAAEFKPVFPLKRSQGNTEDKREAEGKPSNLNKLVKPNNYEQIGETLGTVEARQQ